MESCKLGNPCPIHENRCAARVGGIARCFTCGNDIHDHQHLRFCGSQGYFPHPEWTLVYCETCNKPSEDYWEDWGRRYKERLAGFPNTPESAWNGQGI